MSQPLFSSTKVKNPLILTSDSPLNSCFETRRLVSTSMLNFLVVDKCSSVLEEQFNFFNEKKEFMK